MWNNLKVHRLTILHDQDAGSLIGPTEAGSHPIVAIDGVLRHAAAAVLVCSRAARGLLGPEERRTQAAVAVWFECWEAAGPELEADQLPTTRTMVEERRDGEREVLASPRTLQGGGGGA